MSFTEVIMSNGNASCKVDLHVRVHQDYAVIGISNLIQKHARRLEGCKNVDLWVDRNLYPPDPATQYPPSFNSLPSFLQFLGDGDNGLLRYCKRLSMLQNSDIADFFSSQMLEMQHNYSILLQQKQETIELLELQIAEAQFSKEYLEQMMSKYQQTLRKMKSTPVGNQERKRS